jgi:hypothetical protein
VACAVFNFLVLLVVEHVASRKKIGTYGDSRVSTPPIFSSGR